MRAQLLQPLRQPEQSVHLLVVRLLRQQRLAGQLEAQLQMKWACNLQLH
jgi:hypothetical protein